MNDVTSLEPNKATVALFLGRWLAHIKTQVSPKSHERYSGIVNQNLIPRHRRRPAEQA